MSVVVTGAAGFIGYQLTRRLVDSGEVVHAIDNLSDILYPKSEKQARWETLGQLGVRLNLVDISQERLTLPKEEVTTVYHLAALPGLTPSWGQSEDYFKVNILGTKLLLDAVLEFAPRARFVHVSTSSVYGKEAVGDETQQTNPVSPYGISKLAAENLVRAYSAERGLRFNILRYFSVYGPGQRPDMAYRKFLTSIAKGEEIRIFGDGLQSRTNTYVDDAISATLLVSGTSGLDNEIFNVAGLEKVNLLEAVQIMEYVTGRKAKVKFENEEPGDQRHTGGEIGKLSRATGFRPTVGLENGLQTQWDWLKAIL